MYVRRVTSAKGLLAEAGDAVQGSQPKRSRHPGSWNTPSHCHSTFEQMREGFVITIPKDIHVCFLRVLSLRQMQRCKFLVLDRADLTSLPIHAIKAGESSLQTAINVDCCWRCSRRQGLRSNVILHRRLFS